MNARSEVDLARGKTWAAPPGPARRATLICQAMPSAASTFAPWATLSHKKPAFLRWAQAPNLPRALAEAWGDSAFWTSGIEG